MELQTISQVSKFFAISTRTLRYYEQIGLIAPAKKDDFAYRAYDAEAIANNGVPENFLPENFPQEIYVTFDVDAWDPSLMPATGTPVPGGLDWFGALRFIETAAKTRRIAGADVVELAPIPLLPHAGFTAARMVYALMGLSISA